MNPFRTIEAPPSRLITVDEFSDLYSAVEFAVEFGLPPSGHVILHWGLLGSHSPSEVQDAFTAFRKCVRDWLHRRGIPVIYYYSHENSERAGLHTHFAVHIPLDFRREFRRYVREWATRKYERPPGRGVRTRGMGGDPITVWRVFSYLVKGYDQSAVLVSARNHRSGRALRLGDVIANVWQDPGAVGLSQRVGVSSAISRTQRALGYPAGAEADVSLPIVPPSAADLFATQERISAGRRHTWTKDQGSVATFPAKALAQVRPFRSRFEDACYDVRRLYPREFYAWVTQLDPYEYRPTEREARLQAELNRIQNEAFATDFGEL